MSGFHYCSKIHSQLNKRKGLAGVVIIPYFRIYYRAIKTAWYWHKDRYEDQWNRIEDLDMTPHSYTHLLFDKGVKNYIGENTASSTNIAGKSEYLPTEN
jgi:hypothetical protein